MPGQLDGRVALVTGAASGIGRASAVAFAREGAKVLVSDLSAEGGHATVSAIAAAGGNATFLRADVSNAAAVEELIKATVETYGRLDCAHNNAGVFGALADTADYPEEVWDQVIAVNLKGVWLCMKYELRHMLTQGAGSIVNTSSVAGMRAGTSPAYTASKWGVIGLTHRAAREVAARGIRVNAVCPGVVQTPMVERYFAAAPGSEERFLAAEPVGRFGTPEEIATAVVWLCSEAASFVTGVALPVDGGLAE
jgi:NAD(P)-dependent dehydrogenase (short-subunit alcohol dehydrogenase family)